ncbi:hypothetical protein G9A89_001324 [Geosiphon pyriformis]|nr:hypothetical protein G9A89_001324 [Geosiphon pyriformis]
MIYTILEEKKPINNCTSKSESIFNFNSNFDNNDNKNNGSSSTQNSNNFNSDLNSNPNSEQYIVLSDFTKEQELKWFSNNNEGIMPEHVHDTDAGFDLKYSEKDTIKLKPYLHTYIDLKVALKIPTTTIVQLASRSRNIIAMLQNDSEKTYIIDPNEKIAQAIFLLLVKVAQLVSVENRKELRITARGIQEFRSINRIDVPINMAEEEIIDKREIIFTHQPISILPYDQYMLAIKKKVKDQVQLFEAEATICESGEIGLTNLYISAKSPKNIKISIYNTTRNVIEIPKGTIIRYLTTEVEDQPPNYIPNFSQLCRYVDITLQTIYRQSKYYLLQPKQLEQMNLGNLDPLQWMQL